VENGTPRALPSGKGRVEESPVVNLHTELPTTSAGEFRFAKALVALDDPLLHVWFALDYLPGVSDIDCLMYHEQVGVLVVEIKSVPITEIEEFDLKYCKIRGRDRGKSPTRQAYDANSLLRDYLKNLVNRVPFIVSTACWPRISRAEW